LDGAIALPRTSLALPGRVFEPELELAGARAAVSRLGEGDRERHERRRRREDEHGLQLRMSVEELVAGAQEPVSFVGLRG
jgi:hypothetical protein